MGTKGVGMIGGTKVTIIGAGKVGMTAAYSLVHQGVASELVLLGRSADELSGEELDLEHGLSFLHTTEVHSTTNYEDISGSDVVVITAGAAQKEGETRLDLVAKNMKIIESIIPQVVAHAPESVILMVTNPVDVLVQTAHRISGWERGRVIGTGTTLDTARFRFHLSEKIDINPKSIHAYVLGEHGDHSFPVLESAMIGGQSLLSFEGMSREVALKAYEHAREAAYKIISSKGATYYAIGSVVSHVVEAIVRNQEKVLPLSVPLQGDYGYEGVALSLPCIVGKRGVIRVLHPDLSSEELERLRECVAVLKQHLD